MKKTVSLISGLFSQQNIFSPKVGRQKISRLLLPLFFIVLLTSFGGKGWGQALIDPTGAGGFESGTTFAANGWQVVNPANSIWEVGTIAGQYAGTRGVYVSYSGGTYDYIINSARTSHFYRDVVIPVGATAITLSFYWKGSGESNWDRALVYTAPTTVTPVVNTPASNTTAIAGATLVWTQPNNSQAAYTLATIILPNALAGTTVRIIFTWQNDDNAGNPPPAAIDNISLTYTSSTPCSGIPVPGNTISNANPVCASGNFTLSLQNNTTGVGVAYQWQSSPDGTTWTNIIGGTSSTLTTSQTAATYYHCLVTCSGNTGTSGNLLVGITVCSPFLHPTAGLNSSSCGSCMSLINPGASHSYYDNGGPSANYSDNINNAGSGIYRTFCPAGSNQAVRATFVSLNTESGYDILTITNGASGSTSLPTLWQGSGTSTPGVQTSTDVSGCLTFRFDSDGGITGPGWEIILTTVPSLSWQAPINSDCQTAITICSSDTITATSNGPGLSSTCPAGCLGSEYYTNWYVWKTGQAGNLLFKITPTTSSDDYDFALYKATDCSAMGNPVRCSFYTNTGATGLNAASIDTEESANGAGDGWVQKVTAAAGEYYFLMISDYTKEGTGFKLSFNGSNCDITCASPLPVELLSFDAKCNNNNVDLSWSTATETNNDYFTIERSADVSDWEFVKSVPGAGNSNSTHFYSTTDKNPLSGTSYYRLRQTDFDGQSESFSPIAVICDDAGPDPQISYSPNPFTSELWVDFQNLDFEKASVSVYDVQGNLVYQKNIRNDNFPDKRLNLNLNDLSSGIYMVSFITDEYSDTHRIVKK